MALEDILFRDDHSLFHHPQVVQTIYYSRAHHHSGRLKSILNAYRVYRLEGPVVVATFHSSCIALKFNNHRTLRICANSAAAVTIDRISYNGGGVR